MKRIRYTISIIFIAMIAFSYAPPESAAIMLDGASGQSRNIMMNTDQGKRVNEKHNINAVDEHFIHSPKYNCDPRMLITNVPDIDPHMPLKDLP